MKPNGIDRWNTTQSRELYRITDWSGGYFDINEAGNVCVKPHSNYQCCDLKELVDAMRQRGIQPPILFRFEGIIQDRLHFIENAFDAAIKEYNYQGRYQLAFPVKVNQQCQVIDSLRRGNRDNRLGLEVGSKPELLAMLAVHDLPEALLLCNGYKDREYIELALLGRKLGRRVIIIIEQIYELDLILEVAAELAIEPEVGLRFKPASRGQGRWDASGGERAKFGLSVQEIVAALEELRRRDRQSCLKLLHYHVGSQITAIAAVKRALKEVTRVYTEIAKECPALCFLDVGGGLAVDYDGSRTNFESSMNYSVEEYVRDIVYAVGEACDQAGVPHPNIISESGRAVMAYHAVLVAEVTDCIPSVGDLPDPAVLPTQHPLLSELRYIYDNLTVKNCQESLHDVLDLRMAIQHHFTLGSISLRERAYAETLIRHSIRAMLNLAQKLSYKPEEFERLDADFYDIYFCNFSVFQSLPDFWAIGNLFPMMPIHRLDTEPSGRGVLADITCDSDGKVDRFIDLKDVAGSLPLHQLKNGDPYYIAFFLLGAYQEILGDLHNLFGDTHAVHVKINPDGSYELPVIVAGDSVREVLQYVQYDARDLTERLRLSIEESVRAGKLSTADSSMLMKRYREALEGYTYLVR